jgi:c-di-GMP-binding flagellar brake protein YcgR
MSMITPFPEPESPELERFAVYGAQEIAALLRELRDRQVLVTLYYDDGAGFTVSNVLDVDPSRDEVVLDCAADRSAQRAVDQAREIVAIAFVDSSKIQFSVSGVEPTMHQSRTAFRVRMPRRLLRMQRRGTPRMQPPASRPATCLVPVPGETGRYESARVLDISLGGVALLAPPVLFALARDDVVDACYLDLPDVGQVTVALRVRYMDAWPGEGGGRRCGFEFVDLAGAALRSLQRYLNRLDALQRGDGARRAA